MKISYFLNDRYGINLVFFIYFTIEIIKVDSSIFIFSNDCVNNILQKKNSR